MLRANIQLNEVLQQSEKRYKQLFEHMLNGFAYCKMLFENEQPKDFIYVDVNDAFEKLTGLKNVVGKKVSEVIPNVQATNPELFEIYGRVALTGKPEKFETFIEIINVWFSISVYSTEKEYFVAVFDNITESKQTEESLRKSESKYRNIFENIQDVFYQTDLKGILTEISPSIEKYSGYSRAELIGIPVENVYYHKEDRRILLKILLEKGLVTDYEIKLLTKDGQLVDVAINSHIMFDSSNNPIGIEGSMRDISERKQMLEKSEQLVKDRTRSLAQTNELLLYELEQKRKQELKLKLSEEIYFTTINAIDNFIQVLDSDFKLIMYNDAFQRFIKKMMPSVKNLMGMRIDQFVFMKDALDTYNEVLDTGKEIFYERFTEIPNGKIYFEIKITPIFNGNKIIRYVTFVRDISKVKQVEEEIKQNLEKERELNMLKTRFISVVSHEFRTPLAGIQSSIQLLEQFGDKFDQEKKKNLFAKVYQKIRQTYFLLEDILIIGKDDSGKLNIRPGSCNIKNICEEVIHDVYLLFDSYIKINSKVIPEDLEAEIDETLTRHILINLFSNAIKYSDSGQQVEFEARLISGQIEFVFIDQGKGIPEEELKYIFNAFHRALNVEEIKGIGLGLTIVKRCVELQNGTIQIDSKLDEGTKVKVRIPVNSTEN